MRMCDAFGVPLVVLVDVPGYLPGVGQEWDGVVRRGAKLLHAFAEATVPRVTLVTRKAFGGAYIAMNSRSLGATRVFAWPDAEIAVMGAVAAVRILHRRTLASVPPEQLHEAETQLAAEHEATAGGLQRALDLGVIDAIIEPSQTRRELVQAIAEAPQLKGNPRQHPALSGGPGSIWPRQRARWESSGPVSGAEGCCRRQAGAAVGAGRVGAGSGAGVRRGRWAGAGAGRSRPRRRRPRSQPRSRRSGLRR